MKLYDKARIPKRFWGLKLDDVKTNSGNQRAWDEANDYITYLGDHRSGGTGLTFVGSPGVGKTMLMTIIGMNALDQGYSALYLSLESYVRWQKNLMAWQDWEPAWEDVERIRRRSMDCRNRVEFLLLDDVGKEYKTFTGYAESEFDYLIRSRYDLGLPTLMTSNLPVSEWAGTYSDSMESFIHESAPPVEVRSKDYRKER